MDDVLDRSLEQYLEQDLLRFLTCGSVDDGKSTLIGRLLHDSERVLDDQLAAVRRDSARYGTTGEEIDFALLVDGLEAEREQGITIDVAYRYFSTGRRKFIIADTPGHEQYTRNMATGASTCNLAVILVDVRHGVLDQTRRHMLIAALLGIRHVVVAVNKMDLVGFAEEPFEAVRTELTDFSAKLQVSDIEFIPISAVRGDNVVRASEQMPWYGGSTLLYYLEHVSIASDINMVDLRFPVQHVLRPTSDYRGYAGTIASGVLRVGQELMVMPSRRTARVRTIATPAGEVAEAFAPAAVSVTLDTEVDLSRGDMLVPHNNVPQLSDAFEAMLVWMNDEPLHAGREYLMKTGTAQLAASISDLRYRLNVTTLHRESAHELKLNDIGRVRVQATRPVAFDSYARNRATGCFILIDRLTNATLAAGMILDREIAQPVEAEPAPRTSRVTAHDRADRLRQTPFTLWVSGDAAAVERVLFDRGLYTALVDEESGERAAEFARALNDAGVIAVVASRAEAPPGGGNRIVAYDGTADAEELTRFLDLAGLLQR